MITGLALINEVEDRLRWRQTGTLEGTQRPETRKLVRLLNRVLNSMQALDDWPLLRKTGDLQLVAKETLTDNGATLTNGDATATFSGVAVDPDEDTAVAFDDTYIGRVLQVAGEDTLYQIKTVVSETEIELSRPWVGTSIAADVDDATADDVTLTIAQDRYALPEDFDRPTGGWANFFGNPDISPIGPEEFLARRRARGNILLLGDPDVFTVYGLDDSETFQIIHFDPFPENKRILTFTYQRNHPAIETDEDRVLFPKTHEGVVVEAMLHLANRDYQDDSKTQLVLIDYLRSLNIAQSTGNVAQDRLRFTPSGQHRIAQRWKWGGIGRIDWGSEFDRSDRINFY